MKIRFLLVAVLFGFFAVSMANQARFASVAAASNTPLTAPVTTPVTYFSYFIRGNVRRFFAINRLFIGIEPTLPMPYVQVFARNMVNGKIVYTRTDIKGDYSFYLPVGSYDVAPIDNFGFLPSDMIIKLKQNTNNVNFTKRATVGLK